jgi:TRAP-type C4-dicarboxylate transport system permease small subunit
MAERLPARIVDRMSMAAGYLSAVLIIAAMLVVCYGVALRYVLGASTVWQTEMAIYLLMFAAFVGGAYGLRHGDHVRIDLVTNLMSARARIAVRFGAGILGTLFTATLAVIAAVMWRETVQHGIHSGTAWNPPLAYPHAILPLGMALISLQYLAVTARLGHALFTGARDVEEFVPAEGGRIQ